MGQLYYSPVAASRDGCAAITDDAMPEFALLMLDRAGNCSFTQKVLNAQQAGAVGAVIVDDNFLCGVDASVCTPYQCRTCPYYQSAPSCACGLPYMGDDGHGASVSIPSFMIGRTDGEALKAALAAASAGAPGASASLLSSMAWDLPNASGQVRDGGGGRDRLHEAALRRRCSRHQHGSPRRVACRLSCSCGPTLMTAPHTPCVPH